MYGQLNNINNMSILVLIFLLASLYFTNTASFYRTMQYKHNIHPTTLSIPLLCPSHCVVHPTTLSIPLRCPPHYVVHPTALSIPLRCPSHYVVHPTSLSIPLRCILQVSIMLSSTLQASEND